MSRGDLHLLVAGAVLVTLAYPPFHLFVPSFVCLIPAVLLIERSNTAPLPLRTQATLGFGFGVLAHGLLLYWMVFALWRYSSLSALGYIGAVLLLSAHSAALFMLCGWLVRTARLSILVAFPVLWTAQEWVLAHQGDLRFPWLGLGTSLTGFPTVVQLADIIGARGITFLLALANTALAVAWLHRRQRRRATILVCSVGAGVIVAAAYGVVRERGVEMRTLGSVLLMQPNVGYEEKRDSTLRDSIVLSIAEATAAAYREADADLVVWPEVAVPGYLLWQPSWLAQVAGLIRQTHTALVAGALHYVPESGSSGRRFNSAFVFDSTGDIETRRIYSKQYLVPITERVPFVHKRWLGQRWLGNMAPGNSAEVFEVAMGGFGLLICYESAFENLSRRYRIAGADFLVNITNDAWFGRTTSPHQHAAHLVMRAIENRMGIARAANSGISEIVDPLGREHHQTELLTETYVSGVLKTSDVLSVYTRLGDWVGSTALLLALSLLGYAWWRGRQLV